MFKNIVAPSILSADYTQLKDDIKAIVNGGAKWIHIDIMDGDFVPNLTFGPKIIKDVRKITSNVHLDGHLMIKFHDRKIDEYLLPFVKAGCDSITLHVEALTPLQINKFIEFCNKNNIKKALAVSPDTPVSVIFPYVAQLDFILIMSVYPGFSGQSFIETTPFKIRSLRNYLDSKKLLIPIEVDGGINQQTALTCFENGANIFVAGSYIFNDKEQIKPKIKAILDLK